MAAYTKFSNVGTLMTGILQDMGLSVPSAFFGNTDVTISQVLRIMQNIGQELCMAYDWQFLHKEYTITTDGVATQYDLPADWNDFVNSTFWNKSTALPVIGPLTPQVWRLLKARLLGGNTISLQYRIVGNKIVFYYAPGAGQELQIDYYSRGWLQSATDQTFRDNIQADSDIAYFDPRIISAGVKLRWRETKGFDTTAATQEFEAMWNLVIGRDTPAPLLSIGPSADYPYLGYGNIPDTNYGSV
jgi:hypothetical protein